MSDREQGRLAALLAGDWTTAFDDLLCHRLPRCTLCGVGQPAYFDIGVLDDGRGIAYRLCAQCHRQDPTLERVGQLLAQRYGTGNESP